MPGRAVAFYRTFENAFGARSVKIRTRATRDETFLYSGQAAGRGCAGFYGGFVVFRESGLRMCNLILVKSRIITIDTVPKVVKDPQIGEAPANV